LRVAGRRRVRVVVGIWVFAIADAIVCSFVGVGISASRTPTHTNIPQSVHSQCGDGNIERYVQYTIRPALGGTQDRF
jgi:hypothetical protein